ncbi:hypothetical protein LEP1GSC166_2621 [Leptospira kirschneri]|nr:hypothetical protein LEP1GSC166_2621 [Leptospira kirschneri]
MLSKFLNVVFHLNLIHLYNELEVAGFYKLIFAILRLGQLYSLFYYFVVFPFLFRLLTFA